jgi:predicted lactoylglutathione lyase
MLALPCRSVQQVETIYRWALAQGAADEGAPGERGGEGSGFYGCYFRDPAGNKLCLYHLDA